MQPRHITDEAFQKSSGEDVIGFAIQRALLDVGNFGIQNFISSLARLILFNSRI